MASHRAPLIPLSSLQQQSPPEAGDELPGQGGWFPASPKGCLRDPLDTPKLWSGVRIDPERCPNSTHRPTQGTAPPAFQHLPRDGSGRPIPQLPAGFLGKMPGYLSKKILQFALCQTATCFVYIFLWEIRAQSLIVFEMT